MQPHRRIQLARAFTVGTLCLAVSLLAACGGGSGGNEGTTDGGTDGGSLDSSVLSGTCSTMILFADQAEPSRTTLFGAYTFDGAGTYDCFLGSNDNHSVQPASPCQGDPGSYSVNGNGGFSLEGNPVVGGVTSDGRVVLMAPAAPGVGPVVGIFMRRSGTYSNATMSGNYHFGSLITSTMNGTSPTCQCDVRHDHRLATADEIFVVDVADSSGTDAGHAIGVAKACRVCSSRTHWEHQRCRQRPVLS